MNPHRQLTDAVLQAASLLPVVPADLAPRLATLKARADQEPPRDPEDAFAAELIELFGDAAYDEARRIVEGQGAPAQEERDNRIWALLLLALVGAATASTMQRAAALGVELSIDAVNRAASQWASSYSFSQVRGINETTARAIGDAVSAYSRNPAMTVDDVAKLLEPTFGPARARMIATTEVTRAYSQAATITQEQMAAQGVQTTTQWVTWRDDRVCPICGPLHNRFDYQAEFPYGPPAHVSCRCWLAVVRV